MTEENNQQTADTKSLLDKSQDIINSLKSENDRREEILKKEELLKNTQILGGVSGGIAQAKPELSHEEKTKQGVKDWVKGSALEGYVK